MAKKKSVPEIPKLDDIELRQFIQEMYHIKERISILEKAFKEKQERVVATLGINGIWQHNLLRCCIVQQMRRTVPWRELAFDLARKLYPSRKEMFFWMRGLVRQYKKKPCEAFAKITEIKKWKRDYV